MFDQFNAYLWCLWTNYHGSPLLLVGVGTFDCRQVIPESRVLHLINWLPFSQNHVRLMVVAYFNWVK